MEIILLFHLCEQSGEIKDQEVLAQDLAKSQTRHVKENASVERKNLVTRRAGQRSLEKKHWKNDSFSESEDDRSHAATTKANIENATADSRKCSLDELATIATAITFQNNGGES